MCEHRACGFKHAFILLLLSVLGLGSLGLAEATDNQGLVNDLNSYAEYVGRPLKPKEVAQLEAAQSSSRVEVRALSAALLFTVNPKKYRSNLAAYFTVQDYEARATGKTELISQDEFL